MAFSCIISDMYDRALSSKLTESSLKYPVVAVVGPRQTGKTTLVRACFPDHTYVLLEDPDTRQLASEDPRGFFSKYSGNLILDEVQKVPELLSYIQGLVDEPKSSRKFVLTGSEHLLLSEKINQSLAGRARVFNLLPLSENEHPAKDVLERILTGGYPRIHNENLDAGEWLSQYYASYVERDVRSVLNVSDIDRFDRVVKLCAGRVGQLLDFSSIANDSGVSSPTVKSWISTLKATFICFTLEPHFKNFNKRLIKSPKIFFFDTGLLCYLLRIKSVEELEVHHAFGSIFENYVISEKFKQYFHQGSEPNLYFWRSKQGNEVDLVQETSAGLIPIEIKSSMTFDKSFLKGLNYFQKLQGQEGGHVVFRGDESFDFNQYRIHAWSDLDF